MIKGQNINDKPLLTFALFAYNQEQFIAEAVEGALSQTYSPLEIILSDDHSSDRTFEIMKEISSKYDGPNQVIVRQNERNLGLIGHINQVMEMAQGEVIVVAAGDDVSLPERTERILEKYQESNFNAVCVFSRKWNEIDDRGNILGEKEFHPRKKGSLDLEYFGGTRHFVPGHSNSWRRLVFDVFGPIDTDVVSEDVVVPFRAAILGQVLSIDESLILRRLHATNIGGPRIVKTVAGKAEWYEKHHLSLVRNRLGIAKSFLRDLEKARNIIPERIEQLDKLSTYYKKYLAANSLALEYATTNTFGRFRIIQRGVMAKIPLTQLLLVIFGARMSILLQLAPFNWLYEKYLNNRVERSEDMAKIGVTRFS